MCRITVGSASSLGTPPHKSGIPMLPPPALRQRVLPLCCLSQSSRQEVVGEEGGSGHAVAGDGLAGVAASQAVQGGGHAILSRA